MSSTNHLTQEELILVYYREPDAGMQQHAAECEECRIALASLAQVLDGIKPLDVPEPAADYESRVWDRLQWRLRGEKRGSRSWRAWIAVAAVAAIAFVSGLFVNRTTPAPEQTIAQAPVEQPSRERVLQVFVDQHFESSERVLTELTNLQSDAVIDRERAQTLLASNRLYRRTANEQGEEQLARLLDELETVLMQIAHASEQPDPSELRSIQKRIESKELVFKLRVVRSGLRNAGAGAASPDQSTGI
jgi:hypothetical protein